MYWMVLYLAIALEIAATTCMKISNGFKNIPASVLMVLFYFVSLFLLTISLKKIEIGIAYAIWSGLGTVAISILGIILFDESVNITKFVAITLIIFGVVLLNLNGR